MSYATSYVLYCYESDYINLRAINTALELPKPHGTRLRYLCTPDLHQLHCAEQKRSELGQVAMAFWDTSWDHPEAARLLITCESIQRTLCLQPRRQAPSHVGDALKEHVIALYDTVTKLHTKWLTSMGKSQGAYGLVSDLNLDAVDHAVVQAVLERLIGITEGVPATGHHQDRLAAVPDIGLAMLNLYLVYAGYDTVPNWTDYNRSKCTSVVDELRPLLYLNLTV